MIVVVRVMQSFGGGGRRMVGMLICRGGDGDGEVRGGQNLRVGRSKIRGGIDLGVTISLLRPFSWPLGFSYR